MNDAKPTNLADKLEIVIVSHDRASALDDLLLQLYSSPFRAVKISILDNCSTDDTPEICHKYSGLFPLLTVDRYGKHIGEAAAYFHAVEYVSAEYAWILSAGHSLNLASVGDVLLAIDSARYDVIYAGSPAELRWGGDSSCSCAQLVAANARLHAAFSTWQTLIFRTSLFEEEYIVRGYRLIDCGFPIFPFINSLLARDAAIYVAGQQIVAPGNADAHPVGLRWYAGWVTCCQNIREKSLRELAVADATAGQGFAKTVLSWLMADRTSGSGRFWDEVVDIIWGLSPGKRMTFLLLLLSVLVPMPQSWRMKMGRAAATPVGAKGSARNFS